MVILKDLSTADIERLGTAYQLAVAKRDNSQMKTIQILRKVS